MVRVIIFSFLAAMLFCQNAFAVNVFSPRGYLFLDRNTISKLQEKCNTKIFIDEYYSNDEFIRRFNKQNNYSIIIFSSLFYNLVSHKIKNVPLNFEDITEKYHPNILAAFRKQAFPKNITIFGLDLTGFLFDKNKMDIHKDEELKSIFSKVKNKKIIILDDSIESLKLISLNKITRDSDNVISEFERLVGDNHPIFTNVISKKINESDFGFAYLWTGQAHSQIKQNPNLKFIVHSKASYVALDLIAAVEKNTDVACVVRALSEKDIQEPIHSLVDYFSPYGSQNKIDKSEFFMQNKGFIENIDNLKWHDRPSKDEYQEMSNLWQKMKITVKK